MNSRTPRNLQSDPDELSTDQSHGRRTVAGRGKIRQDRRLRACVPTMSRPEFLCRCSVRPFALIAAAAVQLSSSASLGAQQRDPAIEVYGLGGGYDFGNAAETLKDGKWSPQVAGGILVPVRQRWAVMFDGATSHLKVNEGIHGPRTIHPSTEFYRLNPEIQNDDVTTQRLIAVLPSVVRLWRWDRFSIYAGGGLGLERQNQIIRHRPILAQENPDGTHTLVRSEEFSESRNSVVTSTLIVRAGVLVSLAPSIVLRGGYSHIVGYFDTSASRSAEIGIGYRF